MKFRVVSLRMMAIVGLGATAACSNISVDDSRVAGLSGLAVAPDTQEALQIAVLAESDFSRIIGDGEECTAAATTCMPGTAFAQIPDAGTATYTGPGSVSIYTREELTSGGVSTIVDTEVVGIIGTTTVTYNFEDDTFSGRIRDLFAVDATTFDTDVVAGIVTISDGGQADPMARPTFLEATATGTLEAFDEFYVIEVPLEGLLRGTNPDSDIPVKAISLQGEEGTVEGSPDLLVDLIAVGDKDAATNGAYINR